MRNIEFKDLNGSIGTELFTDTESFLEDLTDDAANILGGISTGISTIASETSIAITSAVRPEDFVTTTVYNPHPGGNSGINCTGFYTTVHNPHKPFHRLPLDLVYVKGDI